VDRDLKRSVQNTKQESEPLHHDARERRMSSDNQ